MTLKPCPCGATPTALCINGVTQAKWATVYGDCCGDWEIEFNNNYYETGGPESMQLATEAWNEAPRTIEAEVRKQDEALIRQIPEALKCCRATGALDAQARGLATTAIAAARARLGVESGT